MIEAERLIRLLALRKQRLVTAESCTGGLLGKLLTDVPGASAVYLGGVISYAYEVKETLLGVEPGLLAQKGAVCPEVACQMAQGARERLHSDFAISTTGNAGPGADPMNPNVGEIYVGISTEKETRTYSLQLKGDREENRLECCRLALQHLWEMLHD